MTDGSFDAPATRSLKRVQRTYSVGSGREGESTTPEVLRIYGLTDGPRTEEMVRYLVDQADEWLSIIVGLCEIRDHGFVGERAADAAVDRFPPLAALKALLEAVLDDWAVAEGPAVVRPEDDGEEAAMLQTLFDALLGGINSLPIEWASDFGD